MTRPLGDLRWTDAETMAAAGAILVVPIGSTEQHGPHLPLSTDTDIAMALAEGLASARADVVVAPPIAYGSSGEHQDFPGTLSVGREAVALLLVELGRSASATFDRMVIVSAHGGNAEPVADAAGTLFGEGRRVLAWSPRWSAGEHAGLVETAVMLALRPSAVQLDAAVRGNTAPVAELFPALVAGGVRSVSDNGVLGDPGGASAAMGRELLGMAVDDLAATIDRWSAE